MPKPSNFLPIPITIHLSGMNLGKEPNRLQELARAVRRYTEADGGSNPFVTAIEGFTILRSEHAKQPSHRIFKPALCITVQGAKWATFGDKRYDYRAGQALVVSVEMPSRGTVSAASPTDPFLGLVIEFDRAIMQDVMEELGMRLKPSGGEKARAAFVTDLSSQLADCALRGVRLLETPEAIPTLYPGIMREICYWLLTGPGGDQIVHTTMANGHERRVLEAIHALRDRFSEAIHVEDLAVTARMSPATFHRQFKSVTSMTPLQYQKQMRLLEARRLMIASNANVETAAFQVGYESASQFSREYTRMFGRSPRRDVSALMFSEEPAKNAGSPP
jgi:AraC-like DNA-binding protein